MHLVTRWQRSHNENLYTISWCVTRVIIRLCLENSFETIQWFYWKYKTLCQVIISLE